LSNDILGNCVRLDDGKGAFNGHEVILRVKKEAMSAV
jgi:hypothetical protein